jgi:hypothetical protein
MHLQVEDFVLLCNTLRTDNTFSPICFFNLLDMKSSSNLYCLNINLPCSTASQAMWLWHLITKCEILGSIPRDTNDFFF